MTETTVHPLLLPGYGLIEATFERVVERLGSYRRAEQSEARVHETTTDVARAIEWLSRRTVPATRLAIVEHDSWTAALTNQRHGSDFNDHNFWAARTVAVRSIRVVDSEARWWGRGKRRERLAYDARIFEMLDSNGDLIRSIACADDGGRWVFETFGSPLPLEATFDYEAKRKKDRFTRQNLRDLLTSVGSSPLTLEAFLGAPRFALLHEEISNPEWRGRVEAEALSLEEADDPARI